jgi:ankyrin repeat protein
LVHLLNIFLDDLKLVETVTKFHPDFNNCHDEDGLLPIHLAMKKNNIQIIKALIQHGADTNAQAEEGKDPKIYDYFLIVPDVF